MEKYLVPNESEKKCNTRDDDACDVDAACSVKTSTKMDRVIDDEYYQKRYAIEEYLSMGNYDEFECVISSCRDDLKELKNTIKKAIDDTIAFGNNHDNFKKRTNKYDIVQCLQNAFEHVDIALEQARSATKGAENVWNDIVHDAMDLQDSRTNTNDPEQAVYKVL